MITKLTTLVLSGILTVGLVAASAPPVTTQQDIGRTMATMVNKCSQGYVNYRYGNQDAATAVQNVLNQFPSDQRAAVALVCLGYGEGYEDGMKGIS